jgi:hypothetical protein
MQRSHVRDSLQAVRRGLKFDVAGFALPAHVLVIHSRRTGAVRMSAGCVGVTRLAGVDRRAAIAAGGC